MSALLTVVRILATILNTLMFLSPVPTMVEIHRSKSVGPMPFAPLVAMVTSGHVWAVYGLLAKDYLAIFGTCAFGMTVSVIYVGIYYRYTTERDYAHKIMAAFACVIVINTVYPILGVYGYTNQSQEAVRLTVGYIGAIFSVVTNASPFEKIHQVFKHRSAVFIPIHFVIVGAVNSFTWVIYTLLDVDLQVLVPNAIMLSIGLLQVALYCAFHPGTHPLQPEDVDDLTGGAKDPDVSPSTATSIAVDHEPASKEASFVALRSPV